MSTDRTSVNLATADPWELSFQTTDALAALFQHLHRSNGHDVELTSRPFETHQPDSRSIDQLLLDIAVLSHALRKELHAAVSLSTEHNEMSRPLNAITVAAEVFRSLSALALATGPYNLHTDVSERLHALVPANAPPPFALTRDDIVDPDDRKTIKQTTLPPGQYWVGDPIHAIPSLQIKRFLASADIHTGMIATAHGPALVYSSPDLAGATEDAGGVPIQIASGNVAALPKAAAGPAPVPPGCIATFHLPPLCSLRQDGMVTIGHIRLGPPDLD